MKGFLYSNIINKLQKIIDKTSKYSNNSILASISAGQDSLCLIKVLKTINQILQHTLDIQYIYIDHQWKANSKYQVQHIINYLKSDNSTIYIYQVKEQCASETEARKIRYQILFNHAKKHRNSIIMTGHNLTDKIETFLQNLFKGTSLDGATSLTLLRYNINKHILFRPLVNVSRNETDWLCRNSCLPIWSDQTNYYYHIIRNRIRHELIPYLKNYISIYIENHIESFLTISHIENEYLKQNTMKFFLLAHHKKHIAINYQIVCKQHIAIQNRILQLFSFHHFNRPFNKTVIKQIKSNYNVMNQKPSKYLYIRWELNKKIYIKQKWLYIH